MATKDVEEDRPDERVWLIQNCVLVGYKAAICWWASSPDYVVLRVQTPLRSFDIPFPSSALKRATKKVEEWQQKYHKLTGA